jgi:protein-tyrosine phosphatase
MSSVENILEKNFVEQETGKTFINTNTNINHKEPIIPIDFTKIPKLDNNNNNNTVFEYREFEINNSDNQENTTQTGQTGQTNNIADIGDEHGGIIYDLIHILDDVYSYSRTVIENNYFNFANNDDFNLVYPNIYIGNYSVSTNIKLLQNVGITHIISVIPTFNPPYPDNFKYLHIPAYDDNSQDIKQYFSKSNKFIENIITEGGKVLIHCMVGRSRSVSIFIAFLINIIQGNINQSFVKLDAENDVSNEVEYKQFSMSKCINNVNNNVIGDTITKLEYQKPQLSNKYSTFILYKKETMINEVEELINKYKLLKTEIDIFNDNIDDKTFIIIKQQIVNNFMSDILKYVKKYRKVSYPNPYFVEQLIDIIISTESA